MTNSDADIPDWEYAKTGIIMWLNNDPVKAEEHFKQRLESIRVFSSYALTTVLNAVISYEVDKIEAAQEMLREVEHRCTPRIGWIQAIKSRIFGDETTIGPNEDTLEEKIIVADTLVCSAILTFLTQDISGLMRGSWLLRRAWKIYEQLYSEVFQLYESTKPETGDGVSELKPVTPTNFDVNINGTSMTRSQSTVTIKSKYLNSESPKAGAKKIFESSEIRKNQHAMPNSVSHTHLSEIYHLSQNNNRLHSSIPQCTSTKVTFNPSPTYPSKNSMRLDFQPSSSDGIRRQMPLSCPDPQSSSIAKTPKVVVNEISWQTIRRLMGAVSFGFGIFQLCVSLLPPNFLRLISFLGFEGNKAKGIACLSFARSTQDIRAPLATLVLLWYYTIGAQLFYADDKHLTNEIEAARHLLKASRPEYATSAIFLFFNGRLKRLQCKTNIAIDLYDAAYRMSAQRELKLLCLHEVGWCRLIHLDFGNAMLHFHELKVASNFSKSFYTYMTTICQGAFGRFDNLIKLRREMKYLIEGNQFKETQIQRFIARRIEKMPSDDADRKMLNARYWRFLIYEMLFLWNAMQSCPADIINSIISDCSESQESLNEPSTGLAKLILGSCKIQQRQTDSAIEEFRDCLRQRDNITEDIYISAYASYELAIVLMKYDSKEYKSEAKSLLLNIQRLYKNYDFENRLSARVHAALKVL